MYYLQYLNIFQIEISDQRSSQTFDLEVFVVWINGKDSEEGPFIRANKFFDKLEYLEKENNFIKITKTVSEINHAKNKKILATPISIEGGESLEDKIENLHHFIKRGLFYFGPTWNHSLSWVSSSYDEIHNQNNIQSLGLNKLGEEIAAAVVLKDDHQLTEQALKEFLSKILTSYKIPQKIVFLEEIPKGKTGKLQRIGLAKKLGLEK